nr:DUF6520 family protein [Pedobacter panaciterrae]
MKKLIFAAVLATVAIGGAFATNVKKASFAPPYYDTSGNIVDCSKTARSCAGLTLYSSPTTQTPATQIPASELVGTFRN